MFGKTLKIYMKSGNVLVQKGCKDVRGKYNNEAVTSIGIDVHWWATRTVLVSSLCLQQIEGLVYE
jgi:hypothetical protein